MPTRTLLSTLAAVAIAAPAAYAGSEWGPAVVPGGGAEGGDAVYCNGCDYIGQRNIQGGYVSGDPGDLDLDIGAGSTENPGDVVINWDVGSRLRVYDGKKHLVASFSGKRIKFYVPVRFADRMER